MECIKLGELEQAYYGELFQTCDVEGNGRISIQKATELFLASNLSQEAMRQIWVLSGAQQHGHFERGQFYLALKLIAAAQSSLPIKLETLNTGVEIPIPRFSSKSTSHDDTKKTGFDGETTIDEKVSMSGVIPPPPGPKQHRRSLSGHLRTYSISEAPQSLAEVSQLASIQHNETLNYARCTFSSNQSSVSSPVRVCQLVRQQTAPASYTVAPVCNDGLPDVGHANVPRRVTQLPASGNVNREHDAEVDSPSFDVGTSPNVAPASKCCNSSSTNGNWAMFEDDEDHMLIGNGVKKWEGSVEPTGVDSSSMSSETDSMDDVWTITEEQREYYVKQFLSMQQDVNLHISGQVAKPFFEKSKLPVAELSKIWHLSDMNHDGALSIEEFCIAMHLVVLRRNDIDLPDSLPVSLMPYSTLCDEPFATDLPPGSTLKRATSPYMEESLQWKDSFVHGSPGSNGVPSPAHLVHFDSTKPVVDSDSMVVHPVALHMSPDAHGLLTGGVPGRGRAFSDSVILRSPETVVESAVINFMALKDHTDSSLLVSVPVDSSSLASNLQLDDRQNLVSFKNASPRVLPHPRFLTETSHSGTTDHQSFSQSSPNDAQLSEDRIHPSVSYGGSHFTTTVSFPQGPPVPPPRPNAMSRSLSMGAKSGQTTKPPAVPPRVQPKENTAATERLHAVTEEGLSPALHAKHLQSAGLVGVDSIDGGSTMDASFQLDPMALSQLIRDKRNMSMAMKTHKERSVMLTRLNRELNQELQEVMEQRITLEIQLEHLRPFSS